MKKLGLIETDLASTLLRISHMRTTPICGGLLLLAIALASIFAQAASTREIFPENSLGGQDSEFFPLPGLIFTPPLPLRTETPTPEADRHWQETKGKILKDFGSRLSPEFKIPEALLERASFWFDVYTRYGEGHHIVHHQRFPWVVFRVVDTTPTLLNGKGPLWLRRARGQKQAKKEAGQIRSALSRLAKRKNYDTLPPLEKEIFDKLAVLPGKRRSVIRQAAESVRTQLGQKDFFERGLVNSSKYLPYMEEEFKGRGLPIELTRLPFVESSFNEQARSKVGASGIWQIMPRTGKAYMIVNHHIDERNSPLKATAAAARLLRSYHRSLGSWPLALTSYNNGIGNIQKAVRGANSKDLATIIAKYHQGDFRFASSNFFTCFLAALHAEKYNELIFKNLPREPLQEREVLNLGGQTKVRYLTRVTGLSQDELLKYNLDLRSALRANGPLPRGYRLHLPPGYKERIPRQIGREEPPVRKIPMAENS